MNYRLSDLEREYNNLTVYEQKQIILCIAKQTGMSMEELIDSFVRGRMKLKYNVNQMDINQMGHDVLLVQGRALSAAEERLRLSSLDMAKRSHMMGFLSLESVQNCYDMHHQTEEKEYNVVLVPYSDIKNCKTLFDIKRYGNSCGYTTIPASLLFCLREELSCSYMTFFDIFYFVAFIDPLFSVAHSNQKFTFFMNFFEDNPCIYQVEISNTIMSDSSDFFPKGCRFLFLQENP